MTGITAMEDRVVKITVRVVLPKEPVSEKLLSVAEVAVMVVVPIETAVTRPLLSTVATDGFDELQVTCVVISWVVWSL